MENQDEVGVGYDALHPVPDLESYDDAFRKCRDIFHERREQYGSHLDKDEFEDIAGLYLKTSRINRDIADREKLDEDTLIDMVNYGLQILSRIYNDREINV